MISLMTEAYRLHLLRGLESSLQALGHELVAGVDEVGRGCLAGPVVAAAAVMDPRRVVPGVDDSKSIPEARRVPIARAIRRAALASAVVAVPASAIDRTNIVAATRRAMVKALSKLEPRPTVAIVDAVRLEGLPFPCLSVVRGDCLSYSVACASILAKVERDEMMRAYDDEYPDYGFGGNKGYGAPEHLRALQSRGPTPIHRLTFGRVVPRVSDAGVSGRAGAKA